LGKSYIFLFLNLASVGFDRYNVATTSIFNLMAGGNTTVRKDEEIYQEEK